MEFSFWSSEKESLAVIALLIFRLIICSFSSKSDQPIQPHQQNLEAKILKILSKSLTRYYTLLFCIEILAVCIVFLEALSIYFDPSLGMVHNIKLAIYLFYEVEMKWLISSFIYWHLLSLFMFRPITIFL
jgi:hypothetical protein